MSKIENTLKPYQIKIIIEKLGNMEELKDE